MTTHHPSQFSRLAGGMPQRSYGAFPSNNGHGSSFNSTRFAAPGPTVPFPQPLSRAPPSQFLPLTPRPMVVSTKKRTSERNRGLVVLVVIVLLQVALIAYRSNTLAKSIDLRSKIQSAPRERSALVAERDRSEREREKMRHDRELWEKMPEDHVPPGAHWETIKPVSSCLEYGKREYFGMLQDIPEGWSAVDACRNTPAEIKGVTVRRPYRCQFVDGSPHIHGYWIVDWDPKDCRPWPKNIRDTGCTNHRSGLTRIEAKIEGIRDSDWAVMCESTPFTWSGINYTSPTHCENRGLSGEIAMWDVPSESCR